MDQMFDNSINVWHTVHCEIVTPLRCFHFAPRHVRGVLFPPAPRQHLPASPYADTDVRRAPISPLELT